MARWVVLGERLVNACAREGDVRIGREWLSGELGHADSALLAGSRHWTSTSYSVKPERS